MKASDFPVDTRVVMADYHNDKGTVIGNKMRSGDEIVAVEWDNGTLTKINVNELLTEQSLFEDDFNAYKLEINAKLEAASALILEANALAAVRGNDLQSQGNYDYIFAVDLIEDAMHTAGWNTSSWHC
jgi:hypothetical protein